MTSRYITLGVLLGLTSFWNGTVTISGLLILTSLAFLWKNRQLLITVVIASVITQLLSWILVGGDTPISPQIMIGFLAQPKTILGISRYYFLVLGVLPFLAVIGILNSHRWQRWWLLAILAPFLFANLVQLSPSLTVNHKFINISIMILNISAAGLLAQWFTRKRWWKVLATVSLLSITATGIVDTVRLWQNNQTKRSYPRHHAITLWAAQHTLPSATFLTDDSMYQPVLWAGRKIFLGIRPFVASAGYDATHRQQIIRHIIKSKTARHKIALLRQQQITYIATRPNSPLGQAVLSHLPPIFTDPDSSITVYAVPGANAPKE